MLYLKKRYRHSCLALSVFADPRAIKREAKDVCQTKREFLEWLANNVAKNDHSESMFTLLKESRHLFGNPKAGRKTVWEDTSQQRDEL